MKVLVAAIILAVISYSQQNEKLYKASHIYFSRTHQYVDECLKESGATRDMVDTFEKFGEFISNDNFRCFLYCMSIKPGTVDEKGALIVEKLGPIMGITDKALLAKIDSTCGTPKNPDRCYAVQELILCLVEIVQIP